MNSNRRGFLLSTLALPLLPAFLRPQQAAEVFDARKVRSVGDALVSRDGWVTVADNEVNLNNHRYSERELVAMCQAAHLTFVHCSDQKWDRTTGFGMNVATVAGCVKDARLVYSTGDNPGPIKLQIKISWVRETPRGYFVTPTSHGNYDPATCEITNTKLDHFVVQGQSAFKHASSI